MSPRVGLRVVIGLHTPLGFGLVLGFCFCVRVSPATLLLPPLSCCGRSLWPPAWPASVSLSVVCVPRCSWLPSFLPAGPRSVVLVASCWARFGFAAVCVPWCSWPPLCRSSLGCSCVGLVSRPDPLSCFSNHTVPLLHSHSTMHYSIRLEHQHISTHQGDAERWLVAERWHAAETDCVRLRVNHVSRAGSGR